VRWQLGLAAIYAEAEDPKWATKLTDEEARLASRFAPIELNGFPSWLDALVRAHPSAVDETLGNELSIALRETGNDSDPTIFLQNIRHASPQVAALFIPRIKAWLDQVLSHHTDASANARISQAVDILMRSDDVALRKFLEETAEKTLSTGLNSPAAKIWLPVLMQMSAEAGVTALETGLRSVPRSARGPAVEWFSVLFGGDHTGMSIDLRRPDFTPRLLLRLLRLAYEHVRIADDVHHEDSYSPDDRDHAEQGRNFILSALLATTGAEGWAVKLEMAEDPLFAHFKDRVIAIARERAAEEADGAASSEADVVALDTYGEVPPTTRDAIFAIMRDRLDDIDDLLLQDVSPRELWATIDDERIMRRALARELRNTANHMYTVDQEGVTADEKETDIRMRATRSDQQAVIELKIGGKPRSAADLCATIKDQLVNKYMAADECRAGCLLITTNSNKRWSHPHKRQRLDFASLIAILNEEADRLALELGGSVRLVVKGLDLRPRLTTERKARAKRKPKSLKKLTRSKVKRSKAGGRKVKAKAPKQPQRKSLRVKRKRRAHLGHSSRRPARGRST
jgi:hypothetical protein